MGHLKLNYCWGPTMSIVKYWQGNVETNGSNPDGTVEYKPFIIIISFMEF